MIWIGLSAGMRKAVEDIYDLPDRASVIVATALLDAALTECLRARLVDAGEKESLSRLFDYPAPLSSFSGRILLGQAVGIYGPETRRDLDTVRSIRNTCAHDYLVGDFTFQSIVDRTMNLRVVDHYVVESASFSNHPERASGLVIGIRDRDERMKQPRERFIGTVALLMTALRMHLPSPGSDQSIKIEGRVTPLP